MSVQTIKTDNMRTAAVLLARGCEFHEGRLSASKRGYVEFTFLVPAAQVAQAEQTIALCERNFDLQVHLGDYERSFRRVRAIIEQAKEQS